MEKDGEPFGTVIRTRVVPAFLLVIALQLLTVAPLPAQGSAGSDSKIEPRFLIDMPTAGMLHKSNLAMDIDFYRSGGILLGVSFGVLDRLTIGLSYGGSHLIGGESPEMNEVPGFLVKIRIAEEGMTFPALVIGFDTQGKDGYISSLSRYEIKSPGLFVTLSRNYTWLGFLSIHGGANYSLERADGDSDVNFFAGIEKTLGSVISLVGEYNLGLNDNSGEAGGKGRGYLNAGLRWSIGSGLTLAFNFKDILHNSGTTTVANRTVKLEWVKAF